MNELLEELFHISIADSMHKYQLPFSRSNNRIEDALRQKR